MLEWAYPVALIALSLVGLVWWLHRRALQRDSTAVSAAFLWQSTEHNLNATVQHAPSDRIWWLRAALLAFVVLALAKPLWLNHGDAPIDVWSETAPLARVIQIGKLSDDVALTTLAVRRSPIAESRWEGLVTITPNGTKAWRLPLRVGTPELIIADTSIDVPAGAEVVYRFGVPASEIGKTFTAQIDAKDGLAENNQLQLQTNTLTQVAVHLVGACSPYVRAALKSHPGVSISLTEAAATLNLVCGEAAAPLNRPTLTFHRVGSSTVPADPLRWHTANPSLSSLALGSQWLRAVAPQTHADNSVLTSGAATLISTNTTSPRRVDVWFDMQSKPLTLTPQYPLLISGLIELTMERDSLDPIASATHSREEANIQPTPLANPAHESHKPTLRGDDLSHWFIAIALALLFVDLMWTLRRNRQHG